MQEKVVIIDNVRSAHNVGSIFRTADGAGVSKVYLIGPTPTPVDRFGRIQTEISKTSLGASESVAWEHVGTSERKSTEEAISLILKLKQKGFVVVAIEQDARASSFYDFKVPEKVAYIFGAEVEGVQREIINAADKIVEIPMQGMKESLNVSVTAGVVLFRG